MMKTGIRRGAFLLAVLFAVTLLFSVAYIVNTVDHDCVAGHCRICLQVAVLQRLLESTFFVFVIFVSMAVLSALRTFFATRIRNVRQNTLIAMKVKLLN